MADREIEELNQLAQGILTLTPRVSSPGTPHRTSGPKPIVAIPQSSPRTPRATIATPRSIPTSPATTAPLASPRMRQTALFTFRGVIAARTVESAKAMRRHLEHMCDVVITTYKYCMDKSRESPDVVDKLKDVVQVQPDVAFFVEFCIEETEACTREASKIKLQALNARIQEITVGLPQDFQAIKNDTSVYERIFDKLLSLLENVSEFLKEGHKVEVGRVLDVAYEAVTETKALRDLADDTSLVPQAQLTSRKCLDLLKAARRLVEQQNTAKDLPDRLYAAQSVLQASLPVFIKKTRERFDEPANASKAAECSEAARQVSFVLEEVIAIVRSVEVAYETDFKLQHEPVIRDAVLSKLEQAVKNVKGHLTKLHTAANDLDSHAAKEDLLGATQGLVEDLKTVQGLEGEASEFVQTIRAGMEPSHDQLFASQRKLGDLLQGVNNRMLALRGASITTDNGDINREDMLEAAKSMLSALKGVSSTLESALDE